MESSQDYILVVGRPDREVAAARAVAQALQSAVVVIASPQQAVVKAQHNPPYLVILVDDDRQVWSPQIAREIRQSIEPERVVIVSLTASSESGWQPCENSAEIDGFFVEPISPAVMHTLRDSAIVQKQLHQTA